MPLNERSSASCWRWHAARTKGWSTLWSTCSRTTRYSTSAVAACAPDRSSSTSSGPVGRAILIASGASMW